jgi:hypothetical protein
MANYKHSLYQTVTLKTKKKKKGLFFISQIACFSIILHILYTYIEIHLNLKYLLSFVEAMYIGSNILRFISGLNLLLHNCARTLEYAQRH